MHLSRLEDIKWLQVLTDLVPKFRATISKGERFITDGYSNFNSCCDFQLLFSKYDYNILY